MTKVKLTLIHSYDVDLEVIKEPTPYAPGGHVYLVPDNKSPASFFRDIYKAEKEKNEWIRKYENVLKGLKYYKNLCLENN